MKSAMAKRVVCFVIAGMIVAPNAVYADGNVNKDESVYVNLNMDGSVKDETVSDWLHLQSTAGEIHDKSNLSQIENIKGNEKPEENGNEITWQSNGNDIFYQGKTAEKLPLDVNIKYYLDNKEINIKDIAGKSGTFKINISFKNNSMHAKLINGKNKNIYTPISVAAIVTLPADKFTNVSISDGQIISEGNNQIVSLVSFPGMQESLGISTDSLNIKLPEDFTITAETKNFSMLPIVFTATPKLPEIQALKDAKNIDDIKNGISDLKDASGKLTDGTSKLYDGSVQIQSGVVKLGNVIIQAKNGANQLEQGLSTAKDKISSGIGQMSNPLVQEKISLITNDSNVTAERKLINDAFAAQSIQVDNDLLNFLKSVATTDNINKIITTSQDVNSFINYLKNDAQIQGIIGMWSVLTPDKKKQVIQSSLSNFSNLLNAVDGLNSIDMNKIYPLLSLTSQSDKIVSLINSSRALENVTLPTMSQSDIGALSKLTDINTKNALLAAIANLPDAQKQQLTAIIEGYYKTAVNTQSMLPLMSQLGAMQSQLKNNDALLTQVSTAMSKENIAYLNGVLKNVTAMQQILKDNSSNIALAKILVSKLNDKNVMNQLDKINGEVVMLQALSTNILTQLTPEQMAKYKGEINAIMNNPSIINNLLSMQKDLTDNKKILEVVCDALKDDNITSARKLLSAAPDLENGISQLYSGSNQLANGINQVISQGVNPLTSGINTFVEKTNELNNGMAKFNSDGILKLDSKAMPMVTNINDILASKDALYELSDECSTFTGKGENMTGMVKFIMRTDEVSAIQVKKAKSKKADANNQKKVTFIQWIKNIFS